jgi:hypothetical protein
MWHSGRKSHLRQSASLPASIWSFFFLAAAIARSINGCHLDLGDMWQQMIVDPAPLKIVASIATVHGWGRVFIQQSSSRRIDLILPSCSTRPLTSFTQ